MLSINSAFKNIIGFVTIQAMPLVNFVFCPKCFYSVQPCIVLKIDFKFLMTNSKGEKESTVIDSKGFPGDSVNNLPALQETQGRSLGSRVFSRRLSREGNGNPLQ